MPHIITGRSWSAIVEGDEVDFGRIFDQAILALANIQANEHLTQLELEGADIPDELRPNMEEPEALIHLVREKQAPVWWPQMLDRVSMSIKISPHGHTPEALPPHPVDTVNRSLGQTHFLNLLRNMLEQVGTPFEGRIQLRLLRIRDKTVLGGFQGEIYIGDKLKKKRGESGDSSRDELVDLLLDERKSLQEAQQRMFGNASNVIHASASAINAMRGANAPPPWMRGEGEDGMPMWMGLARMAGDMVMASGVLGNEPPNPTQAAFQAMQAKMHGAPQQQQQGYQQHQLPGPTMDTMGYDNYMDAEPGEYDGYTAHEDDLMDDGFEEEDEFYDEEDDLYYERDTYSDDDDEDDEDDEEYEEEAPRGRSRRSSGNPLDGLSPDELAAHLNNYIDANQDKKPALKKLGMGLAGKLLG